MIIVYSINNVIVLWYYSITHCSRVHCLDYCGGGKNLSSDTLHTAAVSGEFKSGSAKCINCCTLVSVGISESALRIGSVMSVSLQQPVHMFFSFLIFVSYCNKRLRLAYCFGFRVFSIWNMQV